MKLDDYKYSEITLHIPDMKNGLLVAFSWMPEKQCWVISPTSEEQYFAFRDKATRSVIGFSTIDDAISFNSELHCELKIITAQNIKNGKVFTGGVLDADEEFKIVDGMNFKTIL